MEYLRPFQANPDSSFLTYYALGSDKQYTLTTLTRGQFLDKALRLASYLTSLGVTKDVRVTHYFSSNSLHDLVLRLASAFLGSVGVTVNWSSDTASTVSYKVTKSDSKVLFCDGNVDQTMLSAVHRTCPAVPVCDLSTVDLTEYEPLPTTTLSTSTPAQTRIVIFTSGTTGDPKGVELSYHNYATNAATFEQFLLPSNTTPLLVVVNPMHHTNSTSMTDWAMRNADAELHLFAGYSTLYWKHAAEIQEKARPNQKQIMPLVSRHFDFLKSLASEQKLPVPQSVLTAALSKCVLLLGSAPVGPTTVDTIQELCGTLPTVRFGSTETTLQVCGTPIETFAGERLAAFKAGWSHSFGGQDLVGYYIGREHEGLTACKVVKDVASMEECAEGEPGLLVCRGGNIMRCYVGDEEATKKAIVEGGWYTNLGDVVFSLNGDLYWLSRESTLLIKGGSNYSYEQINSELTALAEKEFQIKSGGVTVAVVGLKIDSEHEDTCCVTVELGAGWEGKQGEVEDRFVEVAKKTVSKGAKPDRLVVGEVPKNFKGAILTKELVKRWEEREGKGGERKKQRV